MKILYLGAHHDPTNSEAEISRALQRLGHDVIELNEQGTSGATLIDACEQHQPGLLLGAKFRVSGTDGFDGPAAKKTAEIFAQCRPHVGQIAVWIFDALMPEFCRERWQWAETLAPHVDLFVATDGSAVERLPNSLWLPQGSSDLSDDDAPWPVEFETSVLFVGTPYRERRELTHHLQQRFGPQFKQVPDRSGTEVRGRELTALARSALICVCPPTPTWPRYWSNRAITLARHGGLVASPIIPGMDADGWLPSSNYLALPNRPDAIAAKLVEYVDKTDRRELDAIRRAGYEHARRLSYDARCLELLAALEAKRQPVTAAQNVDADYPA